MLSRQKTTKKNGEEQRRERRRGEAKPKRKSKRKIVQRISLFLFYYQIPRSQPSLHRHSSFSPSSLADFGAVTGYAVGQSEAEPSRERRGLVEFYYACAGYSVYMSRNEGSVDEKGDKPELPACLGFEFVAYRRTPAAGTASASAHVHSREDCDIRQPRTHKPTHAVGDDFLNRFTRNANLVASGVAKNMRRVGNYMKETIDDILFPCRKRPK
ncbi:uncharacterized protein LOC110429443 isoform X2 [Herrania umbratica]|uniref:Uncharacterized protein LOC110429443 isoform X2 n=1 Tax=Herrania umbratica TaxID=108875 RepID=A0A6J1BSH5_9ROSI|nr:uncharacterized protein LOC110429443 isoform X2 [Herrania umbratica]